MLCVFTEAFFGNNAVFILITPLKFKIEPKSAFSFVGTYTPFILKVRNSKTTLTYISVTQTENMPQPVFHSHQTLSIPNHHLSSLHTLNTFLPFSTLHNLFPSQNKLSFPF